MSENPSLSLTCGESVITITESGTRLNDGQLTREQWQAALVGTRQARNTYFLLLADLVRYGRSHFGDEVTEQTLEQLEFGLDDIRHAAAIGQLSFDFRETYRLTPEHYYVLGLRLTEAEERERWAGLAEDHHLSPLELKRSIEQGKVITNKEITEQSGHQSGGLVTVQAVAFSFERWEKQVGGRSAILSWDRARKEAWLDEVAPITDMADAVRESITS